jgi:hypothetical protein
VINDDNAFARKPILIEDHTILSNEEGNASRTEDMRIPTRIEVNLDLSPNGAQDVILKSQVEVVLRELTATATGPALVRIATGEPGSSDSPMTTRPAMDFQTYLKQDLPLHLAAMVDEPLEQWQRTNGELAQQAEAGDDEAYFQLVARDSRHVATDQTLRRVLTWQTEVFDYYREYSLKASQFWSNAEGRAPAQRRMEYCKQCLQRLGQCLLEPFDQRGKRPLPPGGHVRGIYYGLLCLLNGLRNMYQTRHDSGHTSAQCNQALDAFVRGLHALRDGHPFLTYLVAASHLVVQTDAIEKLTGQSDTLWHQLLFGQGLVPSETARAVTAAAFDVSTDSIERLCKERAPIPLHASGQEQLFLVGTPNFKLLDFPEVRTLWETLTR